MIPPVPGDGDGADELRHQLASTTQRAVTLQLALVALAAIAVVISSVSGVLFTLGNRANQARIKDCTEPTGRCYRQNQATTAAAIETILRYIDDSLAPHRLRNEAENTCQVELFAGSPALAEKGVNPSLDFYDECVLRRSGNTAPPPLPPNPLTTTTTRR